MQWVHWQWGRWDDDGDDDDDDDDDGNQVQWVHWQWGREQLPSHSVTKHHIDRIIMMILMILTILICLYVFAVKDIQERLLGLMRMSSFLPSSGRREPDGLKRSHEG